MLMLLYLVLCIDAQNNEIYKRKLHLDAGQLFTDVEERNSNNNATISPTNSQHPQPEITGKVTAEQNQSLNKTALNRTLYQAAVDNITEHNNNNTTGTIVIKDFGSDDRNVLEGSVKSKFTSYTAIGFGVSASLVGLVVTVAVLGAIIHSRRKAQAEEEEDNAIDIQESSLNTESNLTNFSNISSNPLYAQSSRRPLTDNASQVSFDRKTNTGETTSTKEPSLGKTSNKKSSLDKTANKRPSLAKALIDKTVLGKSYVTKRHSRDAKNHPQVSRNQPHYSKNNPQDNRSHPRDAKNHLPVKNHPNKAPASKSPVSREPSPNRPRPPPSKFPPSKMSPKSPHPALHKK